jgi:hypothetical protein
MSYYTSKYKKRNISQKWEHFIIAILAKIHKSSFNKLLNELDNYQIDHFIKPREHNNTYLQASGKILKVQKIEILDIIELDQISNILNYFDRLFKTRSCKDSTLIKRELTFSEQSELKQWIANSIESYGFISYRGLFSISNDKINDNNDLFDLVEFKCYKTSDTYFLLKLEVTPSDKFQSLTREIIDTNIIPVDLPQLFQIRDFIKYKRIIRGLKAPGYPKEQAFNFLVEDLIYQIRKEFLFNFKGFYSDSSKTNPHIIIFNSKDQLSFADFRIGFGVFSTRPCDIYYNEALSFFIINKARYETTNCLYVIGDSDSFPDEFNQDKILIHIALSNTLYPSWILLNYFRDLNTQITSLRKTVYSFIHKNYFSFNKQIKIQTKLSRMKILVNRINIEFNDGNIDHYINSEDFDLNLMLLVNNSWSKDPNFYTYVDRLFKYYTKDIKSQIIEIEDYFKEISNINLIKTNMRMQFFILLISILGLLLALSNIHKLISLVNCVIKLIFK